MSRISKTLHYSGAGLLTISALYHSYSFLSARGVANDPDATPFVAYFLEPIWLLPSIAWFGLALLIFLRPRKRFGVIIGTILCAQAVMMFAFMGLFIGAVAIGLSGLLILTGSLFQ